MHRKSWLVTLLLGFCGSLTAQVSTDPARPDANDATPASRPELAAADLSAWLDGYLPASIEQGGIAGAVVSVVKDGELLVSRGYGHADVEAEMPMDPSRTLVRVGSTAKLFTWTAVMQLVEQDKLDLDRDVSAYLDFELPEHAGGPVTMNDLMTHRGGFEEGLREVLITDPDRFMSTERYLKEHPRPRIYPAGDVPAYSNYGTALAGYIVERLAGESFDDYIESNILVPLDMHGSTTRQPLPNRFRDAMSAGYMSRSDAPRPFELVTTAPAGSLSSTADDMANFMIAHLQEGRFRDRRILKAETARRMHSPSVSLPSGFATMAHGFFSAEDNGRRVIGHGGDTVVFHSDLNLLPEEGVGVFVSFNSRGARDAVYGVRRDFFEQFMGRYFPAPAAKAERPAIVGGAGEPVEFAGSYWSSRRIETAFLRLFYILQQTTLSANDDGTLSLSSDGNTRYRRIAPRIWQEEGGVRRLQLSTVNGRRTIVRSDNPTAVLQAVPALSNGALNILFLLGSLLIIAVMLIAWPIGWRVRRHYGKAHALSGRSLLAWRLVRIAALANLLYLAGWYFVLAPILQNQLDAYGPDLDVLLRTVQFGALVPIAAAAIALWHTYLTFQSGRPWMASAGNVLITAAMLGIVLFAWNAGLFSLNLEY